MNSKLTEIVIQMIEFFGLASDDDINPDVAVRQLEVISTAVRTFSEKELQGFFETVERRIEKLRMDGAPKEQLDFLKGLREHLGIGC
jgi:hypothetical protein